MFPRWRRRLEVLTTRTKSVIAALAALIVAAGAQPVPTVASGVVRDDAGAPVAGAVVAATRASPIGSVIDSPVLSRPTDVSGRYSFDALGRGNYIFGVTIASQASAMPAGAANLTPGASIQDTATAGVTIIDRDGRAFAVLAGPVPVDTSGRITSLYATAYHGGSGVLTRARLVQVDPERPRHDIDIVLPRKPAVRVAGSAMLALPAGYIDTSAVHRLVVRLLPADTPVSPPRGAVSDAMPVATALAGADGAFVFPAVPAGEYVIDAYRAFPPPTVSVSPKGHPIVTTADRVDGDPQGMAAAQSIVINEDVDEIRLTLRPTGPASRAALEVRAARGRGASVGRSGGAGAGAGRALAAGPFGGGVIAGRVVDTDGAPLAGVQIFAAQLRGNDLLPIGPAAITDADGRYRLGGIAPGKYAFVAPSLVTGIRAIDLVSNAFPPSSASASGKTGYVTTFHPATTDAARAVLIDVSGQERIGVDIALQRVRVTDLSGVIESGSSPESVFLSQADRRAQLGGRNTLRSQLSRAGEFVLRDVPDGTYTLSYDSPRGWVRVSVAVPEVAEKGPLRFSPQPHVSISGRVTIEENAVALGATLPPGLTVRITPEQLTTGDSVTPALVSADGTFTVARVVPGRRYFLRAVTTPPWRQTAGSIYGEDAFGVALTIATGATDARIVITNR